jgi:2-hydroxy-3-keto-5-methylthiopentenyl-1-phosphate phosphatase
MRASVLAVIFDFDDTLAPDSTTKLLRTHGVDAEKFWGDAKKLVTLGYDAAPAYLKLLLDQIGPGKPLGELTNSKLKDFGAGLDGDFFQGIPEIFEDLQKEVARFKDIKIEFYIISGGLKSILEGSKIIQNYFEGVYACELSGESDDGVLRFIKRCVTFTEKTRYLFEINKGLDPKDTYKKPQLVNRYVSSEDRRVPWENMIYIGDGLTDIPCFSLLDLNDGVPFAVFDPNKKDKAKDAFRDFLKARKLPTHFPRYSESDELGSLLRSAVATRCSEIKRAPFEAGGSEGD